MTKSLALFAVLSLLALPLFGQQTKVLTAEKHNEYGLVYSLPLTALRITVTAQRETTTAGPFAPYSKRYLGTANVATENSVKWTVTDIKVAPFGLKDDETQYLMQLKPGATTYIGVTSDGMILSINADPVDDNPVGEGLEQSAPRLLSSGGSVDDYLKYVSSDFLSAQNSMRQAEMLSNARMEAIEAYNELSNGTSENMPDDSRQWELMLRALVEQRDAISRAFSGSVTVEEFTSQYIFIPEDEEESVLFRMSEFAGLVSADDFSGSPVYIKTEITNEGSLPVDAVTGQTKTFPKDGIVYSIPGSAKVSIYTNGRNLYAKEFEFSQFGTTFALAPTLFTDKKAPSYARFSPVTGALIEIGTVSKEDPKTTATRSEE